MAGMLSEYWSALRTRTGPRSSWSASRGAQSSRRLNSVVTSSSRLPGVSTFGIEGAGVEDRLEGRAGLARTVAGRVVLGRELRGWSCRRGSSRRCRRRPARRPSGSRGRPARRCAGPCRAARGPTRGRPCGILSDFSSASPFLRETLGTIAAGGQPLLGEALGLHVERRDDLCSRRSRPPRRRRGSPRAGGGPAR